MTPRRSRTYDIVLLGATGFTGALTAERLATQGPDDLRWAVAGRNETKLAAVVEHLQSLGGAGVRVESLLADVTDSASMRIMAEQTAVLATTVGPYIEYGEPVVAACAASGTDYVDLTGEPGFVDLMWLRHHEQAVLTGARLVHSCGFDSIPHDLGAWFTVNQLPEDTPLTVAGYVRAGGTISGGTYHSAVRAFSQVRRSSALAKQRRLAEQRPADRRIRALPQRPRRSPDGRGWALPLPTIDPVVVRRSARACERYGPDFTYGHFALVRSLPMAVGAPLVLGGMVGVAQLPIGRDLLLRLRTQGEGPAEHLRAKSWFTVRFVGESPDSRVVTEVRGGDPGYDETATMLAQSALCLARDDLPELAGQVTTVQAMGDALLARLRGAGMTFESLEQAAL
jgi:short subunit dehydrogenase-like uncharacterized protein